MAKSATWTSDIFDREIFCERLFSRMLAGFPGMKMVLEHITHRRCPVALVQERRPPSWPPRSPPITLQDQSQRMFREGCGPHA